MTMYEKYCHLAIDGRWIGLEKSDMNIEYFCTPVDARIIGWENSIHYCFIRGYRDMVFIALVLFVIWYEIFTSKVLRCPNCNRAYSLIKLTYAINNPYQCNCGNRITIQK